MSAQQEMEMSKSKKGRLYKFGTSLSADFRLNIISKLKDYGANDDTGSIPRGIKAKVSKELLIDKNCVTRAWLSWINDKNVESKPKGPTKGSTMSLDQNDLHYIEFLKRERPSISLREIHNKLLENCNKIIHESTISRALKQNLPAGEFTRKRLCKPARERFTSDNLKYTEALMYYLSQKDVHRIKYFDEAGFNSRDCSPIYGHALRGERAVEVSSKAKSTNLTLNLMIGVNGVVHCNIVDGATDTIQYLNFFDQAIDSYTDEGYHALVPGDIVVVDNAPVHRYSGGNALSVFLDQFGIEYVFTPTYSPDLNPVENVFSKIRQIMQRNEFKQLIETNLEYAIFKSVSQISPVDCKSYYTNLGYLSM